LGLFILASGIRKKYNQTTRPDCVKEATGARVRKVKTTGMTQETDQAVYNLVFDIQQVFRGQTLQMPLQMPLQIDLYQTGCTSIIVS
jgi:hypothetical protein